MAEQGNSAPSEEVVSPQVGDETVTTTTTRIIIWRGSVEWYERQRGSPEGQKIHRQVQCQISAGIVTGQTPEVMSEGWPRKLIMQLVPKSIVGSLGGDYFRDVKTVLFMLASGDTLSNLTRVMESGFAGCVHFVGSGNPIKVLILLYSKERNAYIGFIPNDQAGFVNRIRAVINHYKEQQRIMRQREQDGENVQISPNTAEIEE